MKNWLCREFEVVDDSSYAWLNLVYEMLRVYNATRNSVSEVCPCLHMTGRNFNGQKWLELRDRVLSLLESEKGTRSQLKQQSRANIK
ncbi:hypothetical protein SARC_09270 [Sphaeroforma arctica JP610]|uniref:Uncharacterized protein n=1 Tax=Sphaeroforma arctica JP610 TaxID=667725 RepID=A0A0L0FNC6_9EUKA|nr:hypothetical protein SARC_09270 [Sphaeroforma arctica JP610]KNC78292.1 hypothetical protein SARC_09270 [Sphaeroforma arctica JP610]|eukprot:XP_014152194.1 hypothetical protein SARC_09270 [Sphaeroforma arctica JP610]